MTHQSIFLIRCDSSKKYKHNNTYINRESEVGQINVDQC